MEPDLPSSVAIQPLNLFENATCMSMFDNESLCLQLTELQDTANDLYNEIDEYVKEKEAEINNLTQALRDRPMTRQQQADMTLQIGNLQNEVKRLNDIKANYERNMPTLIQKTEQYIDKIVGGIAKKRKVSDTEENVGTQETQSQLQNVMQQFKQGIDDLKTELSRLTTNRASLVDKQSAINSTRDKLLSIVNENDFLQDHEKNQLVENMERELQTIFNNL